MNCYRLGYIPPGTENCACYNITNLEDQNNPNQILAGDYPIPSTFRYLFERQVYDQILHCETDDSCYGGYDLGEYKYFSDLPKYPSQSNPETFGTLDKNAWNQKCFLPSPYDPELELNEIHELYSETFPTAILFFGSVFQYIFCAVIFTQGKPFRQPIYKNIYMTIAMVILTFWPLYILIFQHDWIMYLFQIVKLPEIVKFYWILGVLVPVNLLVTFVFEKSVNNGSFFRIFSWLYCRN